MAAVRLPSLAAQQRGFENEAAVRSLRSQLKRQAKKPGFPVQNRVYQDRASKLMLKADGRYSHQQLGTQNTTAEGLYSMRADGSVELQQRYVYSADQGQPGIAAVSVNQRVSTGQLLQEPGSPGALRLDDREEVLALARTQPELRKVVSTPDLAKMGSKPPKHPAKLPQIGALGQGSSSQPPEIFAAQKSKSANVGQWLDRLIAQSKKMHAELSASRREVAGMRGFIQNEYALAGVEDPAGAPPIGPGGYAPAVAARPPPLASVPEMPEMPLDPGMTLSEADYAMAYEPAITEPPTVTAEVKYDLTEL